MKRKRSNGDGSFRKLPSGNWSCQLMVGTKPDGKRDIKTFTAPTKAEVNEMVRRYQFDKEEEDAERDVPFSEVAGEWFAGHKSQVAKSTLSNYKYTLERLKKHFGNKTISSVKVRDINSFLDALLDEGWSLSLVKKCRTMLIQIFQYACANDLIYKNPARESNHIKEPEAGPESEDYNDEDKPFTREEVERMIDGLPNDLMGNSILTLLGSGMRVQELLALTSEDIAKDGSTIRITKAIKTVNGVPELGPPKSKHSRRVVPIPEDYRIFVKFLRDNGGDKYIWTSEREDGLYSVATFRKKYYRYLEKLGTVRLLKPHSCRHTYITRLQEFGVPMPIVSKLVGHSKVEVTKGYTHISMDTLANLVKVMNNLHQTDEAE